MAKYDRDYVTTLPLLKENALDYSGGTWNNYPGEVGECLIKFLACTSHTVDWYFKKYLDYLLLPNEEWYPKSLVWELIGYKPPYLRATYLMIQLYWPDCGLLSYVPLFMYTKFKVTADGVEYEFLCAEDYLIPPLTTRINIKLVQGELIHKEQDYKKIEDNKIKLCDQDIDYDLVTFRVSGEKWTQVRNVFYSVNTERIFSLHKEEDGTYLYLHKTWEDYIDPNNTEMTIDFIISDSSFDAVTSDCLIIEIEDDLPDTNGVNVGSFYRIFPMPNSDTGYEMLPSTTEGDRVITTDDYTEKVKAYPGVSTAKAFSWDSFVLTRTPFQVRIVAAGTKGNLSGRTKEALLSYLKSIGSKLIDVQIVDPVYEAYDLKILIDIGKFKNTLIEIQIRLLLKQALKAYFALGNIGPGEEVTYREINSLLLHADARMDYVETTISKPPGYNPRAIPVLGNVKIITEATIMPKFDTAEFIDKIKVANAIFLDEEGFIEEKAGVYTVYQGLRERWKSNVIPSVSKYPVILRDEVISFDSSILLYKDVLLKDKFIGTFFNPIKEEFEYSRVSILEGREWYLPDVGILQEFYDIAAYGWLSCITYAPIKNSMFFTKVNSYVIRALINNVNTMYYLPFNKVSKQAVTTDGTGRKGFYFEAENGTKAFVPLSKWGIKIEGTESEYELLEDLPEGTAMLRANNTGDLLIYTYDSMGQYYDLFDKPPVKPSY